MQTICRYRDSNHYIWFPKNTNIVPYRTRLHMNMVRISTVRNTSALQQSYLATRLGKLGIVYSLFNFKLRNCIGVCSSHACGVNDCNDWKTEKRHECTNIENYEQLEI